MTTGRSGDDKNPFAPCAVERVAEFWDVVCGFHHGYEHNETLN